MENNEEIKTELNSQDVPEENKTKDILNNDEMITIPDWDLEPPFDTVDRGEIE